MACVINPQQPHSTTAVLVFALGKWICKLRSYSLEGSARYERSEARQGYRSGHYDRNLTTASGNVTLHVPRLKGVSFETAIIERYRRRESSVEDALI